MTPTTDDGAAANAFESDKPDTSARSGVEAAIERLRARGGVFVQAVRATRMAMAMTDPNLPGNPIVFANESFLELSGYSLDEALGQQPFFMNGPDTDPRDAAELRRALVEDRDGNLETTQYRKDGSRFVANVLLSAFKDDAGATLYHFLSWQDVTRRTDAEDEVATLQEAQGALRASEARLQAIFDSVDQGFMEVEVEMSPDGRAVDWRFAAINPAFHRLTGMEDVTGRLASEVFPDREAEWAERYAQVVTTGEPIRFELPAAAFGRWFDINLVNVGGAGSRRIAVVYDDITERKRVEAAFRESEERHAFLLKLSDALRAEPSAEAIANRALRMLSEKLRLDRCYVGIYRLAEDLADFPYQVHDDRLPPMPAQVRLSDFPEALKIAFDRTMVIEDALTTESFSDSDRASFTALELRAVVTATLHKGERNPLWAIVAGSASARVWTQSEISLVEEVTERTWAAVERARVEAARNESEEKFRTLFDNMAEGLMIFGVLRGSGGEFLDLIYREANRAMEHQAGFDRAKILGQRFTDIVTPADAERWTAIFAPTIDRGELVDLEDYSETLARWFSVNVYPHGEDGIAVFYRDISERKRAEAALRESAERQTFLLKLSDALRPLAEPSAIQIEAMCVLGKHLAVNRAQYHEVEPNDEWIRPCGGYADGVALHHMSSRFDDFGAFIRAGYDSGQTLVVTDTETDARISTAEQEAWVGIGVRAFVAVPLVKNGRFVAVLGVDHATPRSWSQIEIELVEEVAERTWAAVERAQAEAAQRASDERYRLLFESLDSGFCVIEMIFGPDGRAVDYRFVEANDAFERQSGLVGAVGRRIREFAPDLEEHWFERYGRVALTGESLHIEGEAAPLGRWFDINAYRVGAPEQGRVAVLFTDISDRRRNEAALREAQGRYLSLFNAIDQGACTIEVKFDDRQRAIDYKFLETSPHFERQAGFAAAPGTWMRDIAPDHDEHWFEVYGRVALTGEPARFENFSTPLDRWWSVYAFKVEGPNTVAVLFHDITERKRAEQELASRELQFETLLDQAPLGVYLVDNDFVIRQVNPIALPVFGDIPGGPVGRDFDEIIHILWEKDYADEVVGIFRHTLETGEPYLTAERAEHRSDRNVTEYYEWRVERIILQDGRYGIVCYFRDISAQVHARQEIEKARDLARETQARLAAAFESVPEGVAVIDMSGAATILNREYGRFLPTGIVPSRDPERQGRWRAWDAEGLALDPQDFPAARALRGETVVPGLEMRYTDDDGREIWTSVSAAPIHDHAGRVTGAVAVISDIDLAKRSADALRRSEEHYRLIVENARDYAIIMTDRDDIITEWLPGAEAVFGWTREEAIGRPAGITFTPEDQAERVPEREIETAARDGEALDIRWHQRKDGSQVYIEGKTSPLSNEDGSIRGFLKIGQDVSERRSALEALEASELRMRTLVTGIPQMVFRSHGTGARIWGSPQWIAYTGVSFEESVGFGWLDGLHPDDRGNTIATWAGVEERGEYYCEHRILHVATGEYRWHQTRATPLRDKDGSIIEWLGTSTDVEELRGLQQRQGLLLAELQHRVRNILAMLRSVAGRTAETVESVEDYWQHLEGRISTMARTQGLLTRGIGAGADLQNLVLDELLAQAAQAERFSVTGPDVTLSGKSAEVLGLAIHELATNSVKYGALSAEDGRIDIRWALLEGEDRPRLSIIWSEFGVRMDASPRRQGFGMELITERVPYELQGTGSMDFRDCGLVATIEFPLLETPSILQTDADIKGSMA